jgi:hypothetical protein
VTIDLAGLLGKQTAGTRHTLAFGLDPVKYPITHVRLSVTYPGIPNPDEPMPSGAPVVLTTSPVVWNTSGATKVGKPTVPSGFVSAMAYAGPNRVFTVEAMSGANTLMRMKAAATVEANGSANLKLNFLEDAIGRTIEELMRREDFSHTGYRVLTHEALAFMHTEDLVAPLRTYLTDLTGFDATLNTYASSRPAPQYVRVDLLAKQLFDDKGIGWLSDPSGPLKTAMDTPFTQIGDSRNILLSDLVNDVELNGDNYDISVIAPTYDGWLPSSHEVRPFTSGPSGYFTTVNMPMGRYTVVVHKFNGTDYFNAVDVDIEGFRAVYPPAGFPFP